MSGLTLIKLDLKLLENDFILITSDSKPENYSHIKV